MKTKHTTINTRYHLAENTLVRQLGSFAKNTSVELRNKRQVYVRTKHVVNMVEFFK